MTDVRVRHYISPKEFSSFCCHVPEAPSSDECGNQLQPSRGYLRFSQRLIDLVHRLPAGTLRNVPNKNFQLFPRPRAVVVRFFLHLLAG